MKLLWPMRNRKSGLQLIELTVASALIALLATTMIEGLLQARRLAVDVQERLVVDAFAWDVLWYTFNMKYEKLQFPVYTPAQLKELVPFIKELLVVTDLETQEVGKTLRVNILWRSRLGEERSLATTLNTSRYTLYRSNNSREFMGY